MDAISPIDMLNSFRRQSLSLVRAHYERCSLQFIYRCLAIRHISQLDPVSTNWILLLCQSELHLEDSRRECLTETLGLLRCFPVGEVGERAGRILNHHILHAVLQPVCSCEDAFYTCRVRRDDANGGKADAGRGHILRHALELVRRHLSGTSSHVGQDDLQTAVEMIDESIEASRSMNVDLRDGAIEEMLERATGFVLCVHVEQSHGISFAANHSARATMTPILPTPPLPSL